MKPADKVEPHIESDTSGCEPQWRIFFKSNCNALFQTALLLTADASAAEAAVMESIDALDVSRPPERCDLRTWEKAVVARSTETSHLSSSPANTSAQSMLQPGLLPVIQIDHLPRICFVVRTLLGYSVALCSQILGVEGSHLRMLLQIAALQLQQGTAPSGSHRGHVDEIVDRGTLPRLRKA